MAVSEKKHPGKPRHIKSLSRSPKKAKPRHHGNIRSKKILNVPSEPPTALNLNEIATEAFNIASEETIKVLGYNVAAENGHLIKINSDGTSENIGALPVRKKLTKAQIIKALEI